MTHCQLVLKHLDSHSCRFLGWSDCSSLKWDGRDTNLPLLVSVLRQISQAVEQLLRFFEQMAKLVDDSAIKVFHVGRVHRDGAVGNHSSGLGRKVHHKIDSSTSWQLSLGFRIMCVALFSPLRSRHPISPDLLETSDLTTSWSTTSTTKNWLTSRQQQLQRRRQPASVVVF